MQKIPQIVGERLKAGAAVGEHPDADLLTAFAERSLIEKERAIVLAHVSGCAECREIVALALPATGSVADLRFAPRRSWFAWPVFRWGFAAAGVALVALGIVRFGQQQTVHPEIAKQVAPVAAVTQLQNQGSSLATSTLPAAPQEGASNRVGKKEARQMAEGKLRLYGKQITSLSKKITPRAQAAAPALAVNARSTAAPVPPVVSQMVTVQAQNEVVEVQSADSQVAQAPVPNSFVDQSLGYNTGPLSRAKPANIQVVPAGAAGAVLATPRWSITAVGGLQRSMDQGQSWQDVSVNATPLPSTSGTAMAFKSAAAKQSPTPAEAQKASAPPIFFRAVAAAGNDVWAGGSNAALFHSVDGGDHWTRVLPSHSGVELTGDIVSVEFPDAQHGTVTSSTPEIWSTGDGGQSWQKR